MSVAKEYIARQPKEHQEVLTRFHEIISERVPDWKPFIITSGSAEILGYRKYRYKGKSSEGEWFTLGISSRKTGVSFYSVAMIDGEYVMEQFAKELTGAKVGRSCARFTSLKDIPYDALKQVVEQTRKHPPVSQ